LKKIISTLLVVTMLLSLMGTTLVSADWANDGDRNFTIESGFQGSATAPYTGYAYITSEGTYKVEGYDQPFGSITKEEVLGKDFRHWDFDTVSSATTKAYYRYMITSKDLTDEELAENTYENFLLNPVDDLTLVAPKTTLGVDGKVYLYSFYAYMDEKTNSELIFRFTNNGTETVGATVKTTGAELYSANGVPHKVDVAVYATGNTTDKYFHIALFVDGKFVNGGAAKISKSANYKTGCDLKIFYNATTEAKTPTTSLHVSYLYDLFTNEESLTKERVDIENLMFTDPIWSTTDAVTTASEFVGIEIENVSDEVETAINNTLQNDVEKEIEVTSLDELITAEGTAKLVKKSDGTEVTDVTGLTVDDVLLEVNGIYIKLKQAVPKVPYIESETAVFVPQPHNTVYTRVRYEDYVNNSYNGLPMGGLTSGFYRFTNEPRSSFTFSKSDIMYNQRGYVSMYLYSGGASYSAKELGEYNVTKNMVTAEYDLYMPEYTATSEEYLRLAWQASDDANTTATTNIYFTTDGLGNPPTGGTVVDLDSNTWNTISLQYKYVTNDDDTVSVAVDIYVNGEYKATSTTPSTQNFATKSTAEFIPISFMRFYSPSYIPYGTLGGGKWYVGDYQPAATAVAEGEITSANDGIVVDEDNMLIISDYSADEIVSAMEGYTPVYTSVIDIDKVNETYDVIDGTVPEAVTVEGATTAWKGVLIKRWIENSGLFNAAAEDGTYSLKTANSKILSAKVNDDGTATLAFNGNYTNANLYDNVTTGLPGVLTTPEGAGAKVDTLVGFAVVEDGKLPKVYTLVNKGLELRSLTYNVKDAQAEFVYREYGAEAEDTATFQLIVAAYDESHRLLKLKATGSTTVGGAGEDGEHVFTFAPGFTTDIINSTSYYKVFVFDSITNAKPVFGAVKVLATQN